MTSSRSDSCGANNTCMFCFTTNKNACCYSLMPILNTTFKLNFTTILVATSCKSDAFSVFVLQACLRATCVCVGPSLHDQLNAKDTDMEKVLLSCDITTKMRFNNSVSAPQSKNTVSTNIKHSKYVYLMSNFSPIHFHTKRLYGHNVWYSRYSL